MGLQSVIAAPSQNEEQYLSLLASEQFVNQHISLENMLSSLRMPVRK